MQMKALGFGLFPKITLIYNYSNDRPITFRKQVNRKRDSYSPCLTAEFSSVCLVLCVKGQLHAELSHVCHFWGSLLFGAWRPGTPYASGGHWLVISLTEHCQTLPSSANPSKGRHPRVLGPKILVWFCLRAQSVGEGRVIKKWGMAFSAAEEMKAFSFGTMWKEAARWKRFVIMNDCFHFFCWHLQENLSEGVYMWLHC